jgi:hypothetical protein
MGLLNSKDPQIVVANHLFEEFEFMVSVMHSHIGITSSDVKDWFNLVDGMVSIVGLRLHP